MSTCEQPLYIEIAAGILMVLTFLALIWGVCALAYYAGRGWEASRKKDK